MTYTMQNTIPMYILQPPQRHGHPALYIRRLEHQRLVPDHRFEIRGQKLEHEVDVLLDGKDVEEHDDVGVVQFLEKLDFAQGSHIEPVLHFTDFDLFDGYFAAGGLFGACCQYV